MAWKYIMVENRVGGLKVLFPIIFPDTMVHADVYHVVRKCMPGWKHGGVAPVSAGSIGSITVHGLGGDSETLGIESNPDDARTIDAYSYVHGIL